MSKFSLAKSVLTSLFSISTLLARGTKTVVLVKVILDEEKLYRLTTKKLSDEANQTIGALRFENNFLAEKTKKLEDELFQVRA